MVRRLINGTDQRKVDSGLKMLIEPIQLWLVASQYYKKLFLAVPQQCKAFFSTAGTLQHKWIIVLSFHKWLTHEVSEFQSRLPADPFRFVLDEDLAEDGVLPDFVRDDEVGPDDLDDGVVGQNPGQKSRPGKQRQTHG